MIGSEFIGDADSGYRLEVPDFGVVLGVDRLTRRSGELHGELSVKCDLPGAQRVTDDGLVSLADFNLSSIRARTERASLLTRRVQATEIDWLGLLERLCLRVLEAERAGAPAVLLRDVPRPELDESWIVDGLPVLRRHPMMLFGDGAAGKSLLALYVAGRLAGRGLKVGYFDWEFDGGEHRLRLEQMFPTMPPVVYVRAENALVHEVDRLRQVVKAYALDYAVLDSVAFATEGPPESAESAAGFFRALRRLRVGSLLVAHVVKGEGGDQRPFGSAFWHNGCRATFYVRRANDTGDQARLTVGCYHRKANTGPLRPAVGFVFAFQANRIGVTCADIATAADDLAVRLPIWQRIRAAVAQQPRTIPELADELDTKLDTIIKTVNRSDGRVFTRLTGDDGKTRIALVERAS